MLDYIPLTREGLESAVGLMVSTIYFVNARKVIYRDITISGLAIFVQTLL